MNEEPDVRLFLLASPTVASLAGQRIYTGYLPQRVRNGEPQWPAVKITNPGNTREQLLCGTEQVVLGSFQVDTFAIERADALVLASAIRRRMVDYSGLMGAVMVQRVHLDTDFDGPAEPEPGLFRRTQIYSVWYVES